VPAAALEELLAGLGVELPVLAAPMAGGPGTPELVIAAGRAGSMGFLAGGYKRPEAMAAEIAEVRAAGVPFAVNLFAPNPLPVDPARFAGYAERLRPDAESVGVELDASSPREDDDWWREKVEVLLADPPPLVGFTFGIPPREDLAALRSAGCLLVQGVTSPAEAAAAADAGADALLVQSNEAGGHSGTLTPDRPPAAAQLPELLAAVAERTKLPLLAAGGVAAPQDVAEALGAGASVVMVGTALLLAEEAGTGATHRAALADPARNATTVTRAFTGRPARGLCNGFIDRHEPYAPLGYPAIHHLTSPLRRAAAAAGEPELLHLWAGTGFRGAREAPAGTILRELSAA
jgi:NAD(P)H-dependent flavin oxidoreductase YrpB (nitropropane dioxygenase family)